MDRTVLYDDKWLTHSTLLQDCQDKTEIEVRNLQPHTPTKDVYAGREIAPVSRWDTLSESQRKKQSKLPEYYLLRNSVMDIGKFTLVVCTCV